METLTTSPRSVANSEFEESAFKMIDVGAKIATRRRAVAEGRIRMAPATLKRIYDRAMPKGDVLALAEVAGIMAAKKTAEWLPLCHPLPLDAVRVRCELAGEEEIQVSCEVITTAKTGVEMEALTGVSAALLCIYDLTKGVDPALSISGIFLRVKEGGKSGRPPSPLQGLRCAVLTVSDRCSRGEADDESGAAIVDFCEGSGAEVVTRSLVPDEKTAIQTAIRRFTTEISVDLVLATGGTGLGPRDITPDALRELWTKPVPGIGELLRERGSQHTPMSWLSRSEAGLVGKTLVILLPGSPKAVSEGLEALRDLLPHAVQIARGADHRKAGAGARAGAGK